MGRGRFFLSGHNSSPLFVDMHKLFMSLFFVQGILNTYAALKPSSLGKLCFLFFSLLQATPWLACLSFMWEHSISVPLFLEGNFAILAALDPLLS